MALLCGLVILLFVAGPSLGDRVQEDLSSNINIINPYSTDISNFSYTAAVIVDMDLLGGGCLVGRRWVLTAASIIQGFDKTEMQVRLGSNSPYDGGYLYDVTDIREHPQYATNQSYNLALLQLGMDVNDTIAKPILYLARTPLQIKGSIGNVTGYGQTNRWRATNPSLQYYQASLSPAASCNRDWSGLVNISGVQFCAYDSRSAPCNGDVGNPMSMCVSDTRCKLLGIFSGYNKCSSYATAFMDIGQFYQWIMSVIKA